MYFEFPFNLIEKYDNGILWSPIMARTQTRGSRGGGGMAVYGYSGKLRHGPQFALICSFQKWVGGLYLRALDEKT